MLPSTRLAAAQGAVLQSTQSVRKSLKTETFKKVNLRTHPLPEPAEGSSFINAPFDTPGGCSGSGASRNICCNEIIPLIYPLPELAEGGSSNSAPFEK
jgi:hypothetical protein